MLCSRCGNNDDSLFFKKNNEYYCRRCVSFNGTPVRYKTKKKINYKYYLNYKLTKEQKEISAKILYSFKNKRNVLVHAVCGAGKTELVFDLISYAFKNKLNVCFAVPRRDVVVDLYPRFKDTFKNNKIISIYGGHSDDLNGDLIVLTTHQLYRFDNYFDLIIMDEVDAFPFYGNEVLINFFYKALRGNYVLLSATPSKDLIMKVKKNNGDVYTLFKRYHHQPIPVPKIKKVIINEYLHFIFYFKHWYESKKPILVFVPTIEIGKKLNSIFKKIYKDGELVHSKNKDRNKIIQDFKLNRYRYLITTSILERGITIKNLQVIIFKSDHTLFNKQALIQISGRVGRKKDAPTGEVIFFSKFITKEMEGAINEIVYQNTS